MLVFLLLISDDVDRDKINMIYRCFHNEMLKTARYILRERSNNYDLAEDAVENAFLKLVKYVKSIDTSNMSKLRAYVITVTRNECFNTLSVPLEPLTLIDEYTDSADVEEEFIERLNIKEHYERVVSAIRTLDDKYRIPLYMRYVEEQSPEEISKFMDINLKTVYTRLERGKKLLLLKASGKEYNLC